MIAEAYARQLKGLLPPGRAWFTHVTSWLSALMLGIGDELARIDARGVDLINESDPTTATETLEDWERILGLPDERVTSIPTTLAGRRIAVTQKFTAVGGQNEAFFFALCEQCGYPLDSIGQPSETRILRVGFRVGDRCYGADFNYVMQLNVLADPSDDLPQADFERVVRAATHAHITVVFNYL